MKSAEARHIELLLALWRDNVPVEVFTEVRVRQCDYGEMVPEDK